MKNGKVCKLCEKPLANSAYFKSYSRKHTDGLTPICKKCFIANSLDNNGQDIDLARFQHMLQMCDKPFRPEIYKAAMSQAKTYEGKEGKDFVTTLVGLYMAKLNLQQYRGQTWEDSTFDRSGEESVFVGKDQLFNSDLPPQIRGVMQGLYNILDSILQVKNQDEQRILASYVDNRIWAELFAASNALAEYEDCKCFADYDFVTLKKMRGTDADIAVAEEYKDSFATGSPWMPPIEEW